MKTMLLTGISALMLAGTAQAQIAIVNQTISPTEVQAAQQAWCKAWVDISKTHATSGQPAAKALAEKVIDSAYGYQMGAVLFKPTLTVNPQTFEVSVDNHVIGCAPATHPRASSSWREPNGKWPARGCGACAAVQSVDLAGS